MQSQVYYVSKLKEVLSQRQKENSGYSMRAFARDLDIHSGTLNQVLNSKRRLPLKNVHTVASKLKLSPPEQTLFFESFFRSKISLDEIQIDPLDARYILDQAHYKVIAEWEHFAVLELFKLNSFHVTAANIADKLKIKLNRAEVVLSNLIDCKLILTTLDGELKPVHLDIKTTEDIFNPALKQSHKETLEIGLSKLEEIRLELRDFSSATMAMDISKIPEAKTIIREFRQKMSELLKTGNKTEVYQLAIQFFPLTIPLKNLETVKEKRK